MRNLIERLPASVQSLGRADGKSWLEVWRGLDPSDRGRYKAAGALALLGAVLGVVIDVAYDPSHGAVNDAPNAPQPAPGPTGVETTAIPTVTPGPGEASVTCVANSTPVVAHGAEGVTTISCVTPGGQQVDVMSVIGPDLNGDGIADYSSSITPVKPVATEAPVLVTTGVGDTFTGITTSGGATNEVTIYS